MYRRWNYLRTVNPHMSTLIAIGGWNEGSDKYSRMVSSPASRRVFVDSVVKFLQKHNFDGLDVDWYVCSIMVLVKYYDHYITGNTLP